jgi:cytochrome c oxidase subunit 3
VMWWGTMGMIVIEGTMFALLIVSAFYLKTRSATWPEGVHPPQMLWGTVTTLLFLLSAIPNQLAKKAAEHYRLPAARLWIVVMALFILPLGISRWREFISAGVWWDQNAYGSVVWCLLGFHTVHLLTDAVDTIVLAVLLFTGPLEDKRFVDVSENALYWYFVVIAWIPIYAVLYLFPRYV